MKDSELRGVVLRSMYEVRHSQAGAAWQNLPTVPGVDFQVVANISTQLAEKGLIDWKPLHGPGGSVMSALGRITAHGVDVVEGNVASPIAINVDSSINVHGSTNVQVGSGNVQDVTLDVDKLIAAIDHSNVDVREKEEAKSLLQRLLGNRLVKSALEQWIKIRLGGK